MRHVRALLPFVAPAALIAAGSIALVFTTVDAGGQSPGVGAGAAVPLSSNGRLAYWRQSASGEFVLWASNLDGSAARSLATVAANTSRPFATRWTGDGRAVAYATDDSIGVINLDGTRIDIPGLGQIRTAGFRLIDQRWSPSGKRVAATLQRSTDGKTDLWVGSLDRRELVAAGGFRDAVFGGWLSAEEVLVESDTGVLGALRQPGQPLRKLVDRSAGAPLFDGARVVFLAGVATAGAATGVFWGKRS